MDTEYVWHIGAKGVYKAVKVHANGHIRPKSVSFPTKLSALKAWLKQTQDMIGELTSRLRKANNENLIAERKKLRKQEKNIKKEIQNESN